MAHWEFPATNPVDLDINLISGRIGITAEPTDVITVSLTTSRPDSSGDGHIADVRVDYADGRLEIIESKHHGIRHRSSALDLAVTVPAGSRCVVQASASDVSCRGEAGSLDVRTASGDISASVVRGPVRVNTLSGNIRLDQTLADVIAEAASGNIALQQASGDVAVKTVSGDVHIGAAAASVTAHAASGDLRIDSIAAGDADLNCVSGDIAVAVAPGVAVYLDLATIIGRVSSELEPSDSAGHAGLRLKCRTAQGDVRVTRAALVDAS